MSLSSLSAKFHLSYWVTRENMGQLIRFGLVGVLNSIIGLGVFSFCFYVLHAGAALSNVIAYAIGLINSYVCNRAWTFKSNGHIGSEMFMFLVVFAVSYAAQYVVFIILKSRFNVEAFIAFFAGMCVYTGCNFLGNKIFTFKTSTNE
jgi:putative flippase GtrA